MKKFVNSFCAVFVLAACLTAGCKAPSSGGGGISSASYTKVGTQEINGISYDIVTFGSFPQSLKANGITVDVAESKTVGSYTYYKGDDNEWYAELNSKYYKVEPIKWRVLTASYDHDGNSSTAGKKLLLAEKILINKAYHASSNNYENSSIRAYLTGDFYATAFTQEEQKAIVITTVVNNARSTNPDANATEWNSGNNTYASDTATSDKIFLLSEQEVTKVDYGFAASNQQGVGDTRCRMPTHFAAANGTAYNNIEYSGVWWLRSPFHDNSNDAQYVVDNGWTHYPLLHVNEDSIGVVPALCLN